MKQHRAEWDMFSSFRKLSGKLKDAEWSAEGTHSEEILLDDIQNHIANYRQNIMSRSYSK